MYQPLGSVELPKLFEGLKSCHRLYGGSLVKTGYGKRLQMIFDICDKEQGRIALLSC